MEDKDNFAIYYVVSEATWHANNYYNPDSVMKIIVVDLQHHVTIVNISVVHAVSLI